MNLPVQPLLMFHGNSTIYGRPNSPESIKKALQQHIDIIEVDIRKSKDGIIYCYHGNILARTLSYLPIGIINAFISVDTLEKILSVIPKNKIVFLDIKDQSITSEDMQNICTKHNHEYWIAAYNITYLNGIKSALPQYTYIYNFGFLFFNKGIQKAHRLSIDVIKIFRWQCTKKNIEILKKYHIRHAIHTAFFSKRQFNHTVSEHGSLWVCVDEKK